MVLLPCALPPTRSSRLFTLWALLVLPAGAGTEQESLLGLCHPASHRLDIGLRHWGAMDGSLGGVWQKDIRGLKLPHKIQDIQLNLNFW